MHTRQEYYIIYHNISDAITRLTSEAPGPGSCQAKPRKLRKMPNQGSGWGRDGSYAPRSNVHRSRNAPQRCVVGLGRHVPPQHHWGSWRDDPWSMVSYGQLFLRGETSGFGWHLGANLWEKIWNKSDHLPTSIFAMTNQQLSKKSSQNFVVGQSFTSTILHPERFSLGYSWQLDISHDVFSEVT